MKVELIDSMGSDLSVVNAARVSFGKQKDTLDDSDVRLIQFLARGMTAAEFEKFIDGVDLSVFGCEEEQLIDLLWEWRRTPTHWAPFAHPHASFRIKAPIFVARQLAKHQIGMTWSEVSRRYVDEEPEFYKPEVWRKRAENVKQGSSEEKVFTVDCPGEGWVTPEDDYHEFITYCIGQYERFLEAGVCPEQARMVLPQSTMTEWVWTGSLYAWANVYNQRKPGGHAQRETQHIASEIYYHMARLFPVSWEALTHG